MRLSGSALTASSSDEVRPGEAAPLLIRVRRFLLGAGVFTGFTPYLAVPYGHSSAVQFSQLFLIGAGLLATLEKRRRLLFLIYAFTFPIFVSMVALSFRTNPVYSTSVGIKASINLMLSIAALLGAAAIVTVRDLRLVVRCVAAALIVNVVAGAYQFVDFRHGQFPFIPMYQLNPVFAPWNATSISLFLGTGGRPFGLFSEPSAMAACIGPWLPLLLVLYAIVERAGIEISTALRRSVAVGVGGGAILVAESQSGMALFAIVGLFATIISFASVRRSSDDLQMQRESQRDLTSLARRLLVVVLLATPLGVLALSQRYGSNGGTLNSSWTLRWSSILAGLKLWLETLNHFVFGIGPGQTPRLIAKYAPVVIKSYGFVRITTVWSILVNYITEMGLLGIAVWILAIGGMIRQVSRERLFRSTMVVVLILWLVAAGATTSYATLTPVWMMLGIMSIWDLLPRSAVDGVSE